MLIASVAILVVFCLYFSRMGWPLTPTRAPTLATLPFVPQELARKPEILLTWSLPRNSVDESAIYDKQLRLGSEPGHRERALC